MGGVREAQMRVHRAGLTFLRPDTCLGVSYRTPGRPLSQYTMPAPWNQHMSMS